MTTQNKNSPTDKTNRRYVFAQQESKDYSCIKLTEGKFKKLPSITKISFESKKRILNIYSIV